MRALMCSCTSENVQNARMARELGEVKRELTKAADRERALDERALRMESVAWRGRCVSFASGFMFATFIVAMIV